MAPLYVLAVYHYNSTAFGVIIGPVPLFFSPGKPAQIEFTDDGVTPWISYEEPIISLAPWKVRLTRGMSSHLDVLFLGSEHYAERDAR